MSEKEIAVIILAAGKGTRMQSAVPKVLHSICGVTMIDHVLGISLSLKPSKIITVLNEGMKEIEPYLSKDTEVVYQKEQLGTADAVKPALEKLKDFKGSILVLYADTPLLSQDTLFEMLDLLNESEIVVLGFRTPTPDEYGRLIINSIGELERIVEAKDATDEEFMIDLCNSGVIAAQSDTFQSLVSQVDNKNAKNEYYLTDIIKLANNNEKRCLHVECEDHEVIGINNKMQLAEAEFVMQSRLRDYAMYNGVTLIDPDTTFLSYDTEIGQDVTIQPNVWIGPGVTIADNVEIKAFSHIEEATISSGSVIGPFARIRPGTQIESDARIGNFVEVKKSKIGKGAKINHLSYIGDSDIGEEANIGAGTITCNYDGEKKSNTKIGKKAFIGSNTAIVAPVTVGDGAFIGAGSTITKNVAEGSLAVGRNRQVNKENWSKAKKQANDAS